MRLLTCRLPAQGLGLVLRRFSVILENDVDVLKWFKPNRGDFHPQERPGFAGADLRPRQTECYDYADSRNRKVYPGVAVDV
jgi:hypothetical protein